MHKQKNNITAGLGKETGQQNQAERTVAKISPSLTARADVGQLPAVFPKPRSLAL